MTCACRRSSVALKELERWNEGLNVLLHFDSGRVTNQDQLRNASILKVQLLLGKAEPSAATARPVSVMSPSLNPKSAKTEARASGVIR